MDLYDDIDTKPRASQIDGWSSGIKMLQTQLAIKKAQVPKEQPKKPMLTPVLTLRAKKSNEEFSKKQEPPSPRPGAAQSKPTIINTQPLAPVLENVKADDWDFVDEYDPLWPNEYEKLVKEKQNKDKESSRGGRDNERKRGRGNRGNHHHQNQNNNDSPPVKFSGFAQRQTEEEAYGRSPPAGGSAAGSGTGRENKGAAIAPPPSLQEISINNGDNSSAVTIPYSASSVAAKIMAKYGFKDGQGLGKQEQGMSMALQVEKTSKRGGRIIHEKDVIMPPPPGGGNAMAPPSTPARTSSPPLFAIPAAVPVDESDVGGGGGGGAGGDGDAATKSEPSITEIMKQPSKVVLLRNMVGPGDVDEELEPEVKDECNTKYGEVTSVVIHEAFGTAPEDAVKIYVEFKRIESAIKAVVDLNGRFFGGRQVRAGFYNFDKFKSFQLS